MTNRRSKAWCRGPACLGVVALSISLPCLSACETYLECPTADPVATQALPARLSQTGLYADATNRTLAEGVRPFTPAFPLWTDGAQKQRWIQLPEGTRIDTSDPDDWRFPEGTKVWKEFAVDGMPIETRLLQRVGPEESDWVGVAYVWEGADDAMARPRGVVDALGTTHNVPGAGECMGCHGGRRSRVLGFSAVQLGGPDGNGDALLELAESGLLTDPTPATLGVPGTEVDRAAFGYLHANCAHCHNAVRPPPDASSCLDPDNELDFAIPARPPAQPSEMPAYRTAVGEFITPGSPDDSLMYTLITTRGAFNQMPPIGTEQVDPEASQRIGAWIGSLP